jgi:hypothetical protein
VAALTTTNIARLTSRITSDITAQAVQQQF